MTQETEWEGGEATRSTCGLADSAYTAHGDWLGFPNERFNDHQLNGNSCLSPFLGAYRARNLSIRTASRSFDGFSSAFFGTSIRCPSSSCSPCRSIGPSCSSSTSPRTRTR